ncbi:hypothetical protein LCGC14_1062960 [marine sediment metagenome]|uniref:Uncharacterized protein n=1 Tax=marine sediment metagenome TaxID=412755 RepID=A0A0F9QRK4_9ZZZZ
MKLTYCSVDKNERGDSGWLIRFPYNPEFLEEFKDAIDRHYREWRSAIKSWWVDEEAGGMLAGLFENWDMPISQDINTIRIWTAPKCQKCNGRGYVPSTHLGKFSGKIIPNAYMDCECKVEEPEHYRRMRAEDFDFPMSYAWRSYFEEQITGKPLPSTDPPEASESTPRVTEVIHRHSEMGQKEFDLLQQTARTVGYLQGEIDRLKTRRKPRGEY